MKAYTIVKIDVDGNATNMPIEVENYGLMSKGYAQKKLFDIYKEELIRNKDNNISTDRLNDIDGICYFGILYEKDSKGRAHKRYIQYHLMNVEEGEL